MKKNILLIGLLITVVISGCKKDKDDPTPVVPEPIAGFTLTNDNCDAPCGVVFTNTSLHATSYLWDFGDGTTSTATSPTHIYTADGDYNVKLVATNTSGTHTFSDSVSIVPTVYHLRFKINNQLIEHSTFQAQRGLTSNSLDVLAEHFQLRLHFPPNGLSSGQTIILNSQSFGFLDWYGFGGGSYYSTENPSSSITLYLDYINYVQGGIISGRFSGTLTSGASVSVTEGSFKVQFSN